MYPRKPLMPDHFQGLGRIVGDQDQPLVELLNHVRAGLGGGAYLVSRNLAGAYPSIEEAIAQAVAEVPVEVPRRTVSLFMAPGEWHTVDVDLPTTHSWIIDGNSRNQPFYGTGGLKGRLRTPGFKQSETNPEKNRLLLRNLTIGDGGYTPATGFVLQADLGWNVALIDSLVIGGLIELYSDPSIVAPGFNSNLYLWLKNLANNGATAIKYVQAARSNPGTTIVMDDCAMLAGDGEFGVFPGSWRLNGYVDIRIAGSQFLAFAEAGPGCFKGIGAAPCTGSIRFLNSHFYVLSIFSQYNLFGSNMAPVEFEWGNGSSLEEANFGGAGNPMSFANVTHRKAPILVSRAVPLSPPRGTVRRDENATEKYLFWNGAAWV